MERNSDSINWPPEFSELKRLDGILKCGICYDYMKNCMITSCSHTYCSLCIRKFMQYKNQCPTCYEETFEINLRNNRPLDEVINIYIKVRDKLLRASRLASVNIPMKYENQEKQNEDKESFSKNSSTEEPEIIDLEKVKSGTDNSNNVEVKTSQPIDNSVVINGIKVPGMFTSPKISCGRPRRPEELTKCPVCQVKVPARNINIHLDSCLALDQETRPKKNVRRRSPLPKRVYTMMSEKNLKKFLKDYGLNTTGDRKAMISRLQRYTVIFNAENDSTNPRPVSELIKQLEKEEKGGKKSNSVVKCLLVSGPRTSALGKDVEALEKANKAYCEENRAHFNKLIEQMRLREGTGIKPLKPTSRIYSDDEDDRIGIFNPLSDDIPTTSGCNAAEEVSSNKCEHSDNSSDTDDDIFEISDSGEKEQGIGRIDWNKTIATNDQATPETIYDVLTQIPSENASEIPVEGSVQLKGLGIDTSVWESNAPSVSSLSTEYSDSDTSMFDNPSIVKSNLKSKTSNSKKHRNLSLSWRKKANSRNKPKEDDGTFSDESLNEDCSLNNIENDLANTNELSDTNQVFCEENIGTTEEVKKAVHETPPKRMTRSAKRKSVCKESEKKNEDEQVTTCLARKKSKTDIS